MNFNLKNATSKQKKSSSSKTGKNTSLSFGLNTRKNDKISSALQGDSSSNSESEENDDNNNDSGNASSRKNVNREVAAEQTALRKRAEKALLELSSASAGDIYYDYDAEYESFSSGHQQQIKKDNEKDELNRSRSNTDQKQSSRYIAKLMEKAKERKQEREIVYERKIAKEQEAEGLNDELLGKDKFVTKAYKRILEERENWLEKDAKQSEIEEEEDVTKKKGFGVMGLYTNYNSALGSRQDERKEKDEPKNDSIFNRGVNQDTPNGDDRFKDQSFRKHSPEEQVDMVTNNLDEVSDHEINEELQEQAARAKRMHKIFSARDRYLGRIGASQCASIV